MASPDIRFPPDRSYVLLRLDGPVGPDEEAEALSAVFGDDRWPERRRLLVDRRRCRMLSGPADVHNQIRAMRVQAPALAGARVVVVAPRDYEFAVSRMIQLRLDVHLANCRQEVVRTLTEACAWLGVPESEVRAELEADVA